MTEPKYTLWFGEISAADINLVGGKNASLGELTKLGLPVPEGFAVTSLTYDEFIQTNRLDKFITNELANLNIDDIKQLEDTSERIRENIINCEFPEYLKQAIWESYETLCNGKENVSCAVRSSAINEDLPTASFAGQQDTFLNIKGKENIIKKVKECFSSLFTPRAIFYRKTKGFDNSKVKSSVGIQRLVNAEKAGVIFTTDPNTGNDNLLVINSSYGLGEAIVSGSVVPDQFYVFKNNLQPINESIGKKTLMTTLDGEGTKTIDVPSDLRCLFSLTKEEIRKLSEYAMIIQQHYARNMDIEFAIENRHVYILQARPETVHSTAGTLEEAYTLKEKSKELLKGIAIGRKIGQGKVKILHDTDEMDKFEQGEVLVTRNTTPYWVPVMNKASAIVTEEGGTTSHAAIVSRELGIPCIVGATDALGILSNYEGKEVTVDCTEGIGRIYEGKLNYECETIDIRKIPKTKTKIMMNISVPEGALHHAKKADGVGLLRIEFVYANGIGIHPLALINYDKLKAMINEKDGKLKETLSAIEEKTKGYDKKEEFFVKKLAEGIATIAAATHPNDVVVRFSDFKTNEYQGLLGGYLYELEENNPMLGWRGASRYIHPIFEPAFRLECRAIKEVREKGLRNIIPMIPFCRTTKEIAKILQIMEEENLKRGDIQVYVMAELPSNIWNVEEFCQYVDGFSIGSNDLTQLILGVDRDSAGLAGVTFDERDISVKKAMSHLIKTAHKFGKKVGICGQAPSDYPEFVEFLIKEGIDSISLNPDVLGKMKKIVSRVEDQLMVRPVNFSDSIVFLKVDMNVPTNDSGKIIDDHKIIDGINAAKWCFDNGAHIVITISHQGRKKEDTLKNHLPIFEKNFPNRVKFIVNVTDLPDAIKHAKVGDVVILENIRSFDEEKNYSDVTQTMFYKTFKEIEKSTSKRVVYAKDDFAVSHRKDLTVYALPKQLKEEGYEVVAGQLMKNEIARAKTAKEEMEKSKIICIWGGGKFEDYLHLFEPFLVSYKNSIILTSGPLSLLMLKASGKNIGKNENVFGINDEIVNKTTELMEKYSSRIIVPKDYYVENSDGKELVDCDQLNGIVVDIGTKTVELYKSILTQNSNSIIIGNGPLGQYEKLENAKGTIQVYTEVFNPLNKHFIIGGGGDFNAMMDILGFESYLRSSGGKAFLELIVFGSLPGLEPLELSL